MFCKLSSDSITGNAMQNLAALPVSANEERQSATL